MRLVFASVISLSALCAQAAPFSEHIGQYKVTSCSQSAEYTLANFCNEAKIAHLSLIQGATSLVVLQGRDSDNISGAVSILFQDSTTNPSASYSSQVGVDALIDPAVDSTTSLIKMVTVRKLSEKSISLSYKETASGWPVAQQNVPYTVEMILTKSK